MAHAKIITIHAGPIGGFVPTFCSGQEECIHCRRLVETFRPWFPSEIGTLPAANPEDSWNCPFRFGYRQPSRHIAASFQCTAPHTKTTIWESSWSEWHVYTRGRLRTRTWRLGACPNWSPQECSAGWQRFPQEEIQPQCAPGQHLTRRQMQTADPERQRPEIRIRNSAQIGRTRSIRGT